MTRDPDENTTAGRFLRVSAWRAGIVIAAVLLLTVFAFGQLFTTFPLWDDEGYFLQAYRDFLSGHPLYSEVYSFYGPLTFFIAALEARFDAVNVTHDYFRWMLLPFWIIIASLMAGVVWRWTGRFSVAIAAFLLIGFRLRGLALGVGHPQVWIVLAAGLLLWLGLDWGSGTGRESCAFWSGIVVGAIVLLKINIGILVFIAIALAASLRLKPRPAVITAGILLSAAASAGMGLFIASTTRSEKWFALAYLVALAAIIATALGVRPRACSSPKFLIWMGVGMVLCVGVGTAVTLALGTTPQALFRGLVTNPALLTKSFHNPFLDATRKGSILLSMLAVGAATVTFWRLPRGVPHTWFALLKAGSGALLLCAFWYDQRMALTGSLLFLWLLVIDGRRMSAGAFSDRLLLALLSTLFSLQLYPMAGEQVDWAALMPITAGAVLFGDGLNSLEGEHASRPWFDLAAAGAGALAASCLFVSVGAHAVDALKLWRSEQALNLRGAHWLRLAPRQTAQLTATVAELRKNCHSVLIVPGLYSFSLWSGVPVAQENKINIWPFLWPDRAPSEELYMVRRKNAGCVLVSENMYRFFKWLSVSKCSSRTRYKACAQPHAETRSLVNAWDSFEQLGSEVLSGDDQFLLEIRRTMVPISAIQDVTLYRFSRAGPS